MTDEQLRSRSRLLGHLVALVLALLSFAALIELVAVLRGKVGLDYLFFRLAMPFYLWAIWSARRMILAVGAGRNHDRQLARLLTQVGVALFLGGITTVFAAPLLRLAIVGRGAILHYDVASITLGVVGLTLVIVSRLLAAAADMRRELDEIL